jgi:hypothetical protein
MGDQFPSYIVGNLNKVCLSKTSADSLSAIAPFLRQLKGGAGLSATGGTFAPPTGSRFDRISGNFPHQNSRFAAIVSGLAMSGNCCRKSLS